MKKKLLQLTSVILCVSMVVNLPYVAHALEEIPFDNIINIIKDNDSQDDNSVDLPELSKSQSDQPVEQEASQESVEKKDPLPIILDSNVLSLDQKNILKELNYSDLSISTIEDLMQNYGMDLEESVNTLYHYPLKNDLDKCLTVLQALLSTPYSNLTQKEIVDAFVNSYDISDIKDAVVISETMGIPFRDILSKSNKHDCITHLHLTSEPTIGNNEDHLSNDSETTSTSTATDITDDDEPIFESSESTELLSNIPIPDEDKNTQELSLDSNTIEQSASANETDLDKVLRAQLEKFSTNRLVSEISQNSNLIADDETNPVARNAEIRTQNKLRALDLFGNENAIVQVNDNNILDFYNINVESLIDYFSKKDNGGYFEELFYELLTKALDYEENQFGIHNLNTQSRVGPFSVTSASTGKISNPLLSPLTTSYNTSISAPFSVDQNKNEEINLNTGSLTVSYDLIQVPDKNGNVLDLELLYDSSKAKLGTEYYEQREVTGYVIFLNRTFLRYNNYSSPFCNKLSLIDVFYDKASCDAQLLDHQSHLHGEIMDDLNNHNSYRRVTASQHTINCWVVENKVNPETYSEKANNLGAGWMWNVPNIQIENDYKTLTLGGATYELNADLTFKDHTLTDIQISQDLGSYNNGQTTSSYLVTTKDGTRFYFGNNGEILAQIDRFDNTIKYSHTLINNFPVLNKITDSVGREINITYTSDAAGKYVEITAPDNSKTRLDFTTIPNSTSDYSLSKMVDAKGRTTTFEYTYEPVNFAYDSSIYNTDGINTIAWLKSINYPTGAKTQYLFSIANEHIGTQGSIETYKVASRKDIQTSDGIGTENNKKQYIYGLSTGKLVEVEDPEARDEYYCPCSCNFRPYYGDPPHNVSWIPCNTSHLVKDRVYKFQDNYTYQTIVKGDKINVYTFNDKHLRTQEQYQDKPASEDGTGTIYNKTVYTYNADKLPITETNTKYYNGLDSTVTKVCTYDKKGNLLTELNEKANGDVANTEYLTTYTYHDIYNYPLSQIYKQDANTTIKIEYVPTLDGKAVEWINTYANNILKSKIQSKYDAYGNVIETVTFPDVQSIEGISTFIDYTDNVTGRNLNGVYVTKKWNTNVRDVDNELINSNGIVEEQYYYDIMGRLVQFTDANGNNGYTEYDTIGRTTKITDKSNRTATYVYDDILNIVTYTDYNNNSTLNSYDQLGNLVSSKNLVTNDITKTLEYDSFGRVSEEYNTQGLPTSNVTQYSYDHYDRVVQKKILGTSGDTSIYQENTIYTDVLQNGNSKITTSVPMGNNKNKVLNEYFNKYGEKVQTGGVLNGSDQLTSTYYEYNYLGQPVKAKQYIGDTLTTVSAYDLDYDGNILKEYDALNNYAQTTYDALGRAVAKSDKAGKVTTYTYDSLGRIIKTEKPFSSTNKSIELSYYDNNGNVIKKKVTNNAEGEAQTFSVSEYKYDDINKLTDVILHNTETDKQYTHYEYDNMGNLTATYTGLSQLYSPSMTPDQYSVTRFEFNSNNLQTKIVDALGKQDTYTYDGNSFLTDSIDRNGNKTKHTYNSLGMKLSTEVLSPANASLNKKVFTNDQAGNVTTAAENGITVSYTYDELGRLIQDSDTTGIVKSYTYNERGNRTGFTTVKSGASPISTTYTYDNLDRLDTVSENGTVTAQYTYDLNGNRATLSESNGITTSYTYNEANLVTSLTNKKGSDIVSSYIYTYYLDGKQKTKTDHTDKTTTYVYDNLGRLASEFEANGKNYSYSYDTSNNRK